MTAATNSPPVDSAASGPGASDTPAGLSLAEYAAFRARLEDVRHWGVGSTGFKHARDLYLRFCDDYGHAILTTCAAALGEPLPADWPQNMVSKLGEETVVGG